jgi:hypothetical protein
LQERIWTEKPDAPIAAPPRHDIGLTPEQTREVAARVAAAEAAPRLRTTPAHPRVAVVESMPMRAPVTSCACGCGRALRSDNRSGYAGNCGSSQSALRLARHAANQQQATHELPATAPAEEEDVMPKGYARGTPCKTCKATGPRHKKGCAEDGKAPPARSAGRRGARGGEERGVTGSSKVDALLARREELLSELGVLEANLRNALADEETRLARLRAAVAASVERAGKAA